MLVFSIQFSSLSPSLQKIMNFSSASPPSMITIHPSSPPPPSPSSYVYQNNLFFGLSPYLFLIFPATVVVYHIICKIFGYPTTKRLDLEAQRHQRRSRIDRRPPANSFNHPARNNNENSNHHGWNDNVLRLGLPAGPIELPALPAAKRPPPPQSSTVFTCTTTSASDATDECAICFDDFVDGQVCRLLGNCQHSFHKLCIDQWLATGETYCPVCRAPV